MLQKYIEKLCIFDNKFINITFENLKVHIHIYIYIY